MQLRSWLGKVKQTCLLEVFGFLFRTQWEQPGHQNSVRVNGVCALVSSCKVLLFMQLCRTETLQGKIRNKGKARRWREKDNSILICKCVTYVLGFLFG